MPNFAPRKAGQVKSGWRPDVAAIWARAVNRYLTRILIGLAWVALFGLHALGLSKFTSIEHLDRLGYDTQVRMSATAGADPRIAIVDIDDASLAKLGRWPWGRDIMAALVGKLFERYGARIVGFDVVFAEPDQSSGLAVLDRLLGGPLQHDVDLRRSVEEMRPSLDNDARMAAALRGKPAILGFYVANDADSRAHGALPAPLLTQAAFGDRQVDLLAWRGYNGNLTLFQSAAAGAGHFNQLPDSDGISRRIPLLVDYGGQIHGALSLAIVRALQDQVQVVPSFAADRGRDGRSVIQALQVGSLRVPLGERATVLIPFRGGRGSFKYYSAADLFEDRVNAKALDGQIVLVGTSAPGLFDLRATPVASVFPGVEIHANLVAGMLDQAIKSSTHPIGKWLAAAFVATGIILAIWLPFLTPVRAVSATLGVLIAMVGMVTLGWHTWNTFVPAGAPLLMLLALLGTNVLFGYFTETRARKHMAQLFGEYVPPALVNQMAEDPEKYSGEARSDVLTVLFADLRSFTSLSESLEPAKLRLLLNEYFTEVSHVIHEHRGTVDKYIGDGVMAFWGAPIGDPEHARNAVKAGLAIQAAARRAQERLPFGGDLSLAVGVGINTGLMSVGDMGSRLRREYTVIGDSVNLAARLESLTKYYGVAIIIGARTREHMPELVCRELDRVRVQGKEEVVLVYEPLGIQGEIPAVRLDELKMWNQMLRAYRARDWDQAEIALIMLQRRHGRTTLNDLYATRIAQFRAAPPPAEWDGVTTFNRK